MSIRWIKTVNINGEPKTIEIQLGYVHIGDRCYTRIGNDLEEYFVPHSDDRDSIIYTGLERLQARLFGEEVTYPDGRTYDWA